MNARLVVVTAGSLKVLLPCAVLDQEFVRHLAICHHRFDGAQARFVLSQVRKHSEHFVVHGVMATGERLDGLLPHLHARDVTLLFNDVGVGYWLYRNNRPDSLISGIAPVTELHVNTPLNHRGLDHFPIGFQDSVNFTGGAYVYLHKAVFGVAVGRPLTGPKPYDYEVNATFGHHI